MPSPGEQSRGSDPGRTRLCPVCGSASSGLIHRQEFARVEKVTLLTGFDVVVCRGCGFAFADGIPPQAAFDRYYQEQSKYDSAPSRSSEQRLEVMRDGLDFLTALMPDRHASILEVGCGSGDFLVYLKDDGFADLTALEPSAAVREFLEGRHGVRCVTGSLSSSEVLGAYDVVLLLTVLEHIVDLQAAVARVSSCLRPGGLLVARVPDSMRFAAFDDAPFQQFSPEHINYFSLASLDNLLGPRGFVRVAAEQVALPETEASILPMLDVAFRRAPAEARVELRPDARLADALREYVRVSEAKARALEGPLRALADSQEAILVWGVGTHTLRLLESGALGACNIVAFVDSNAHYVGGEFRGVPVVGPADVHRYPHRILISSRVYQNEILDFITDDLHAPNDVLLLYGTSA